MAHIALPVALVHLLCISIAAKWLTGGSYMTGDEMGGVGLLPRVAAHAVCASEPLPAAHMTRQPLLHA